MDKFKVIVAGGRDFNNYQLLKDKLNIFLKNQNNIEIVCGKAYGADTLGEQYAKQYNLDIKYFPAQWDLYGKRAGYLRNSEMADYADALIAFWDGKSKGTSHMINLAKEKGLKVKIVMY